MTRAEHMKWCKERAIAEFDYYKKTSSMKDAIGNGMLSMMSDLRKHKETNVSALMTLTLMMIGKIDNEPEFRKFIAGFAE
jgi:hypothetical protein